MSKLRNLLLNERFILMIILINGIVIFLQGFDFCTATIDSLERIDNVITLIFLIEILVKIKEYGSKEYFADSWNRFDFTLVLLALPSLMFLITGSSYVDLDFLLVLRIARVFKFFRFMRFFPQIDELVKGIKRAIKASFVMLIGFFVFIFIMSIVSTFLFKEYSPEYFGDPLKSFYSMFKVFTVEGWYEIPDELAANLAKDSPKLSTFTTVFFSLILLIGGIFGLSLVNSIFVDTMVADNNDELEAKVESLEKKIDQLLEKHEKL